MTHPPEPPPPPDDAWPAPDDATLVSPRGAVVEEQAAPAPVGPPPDRRIGAGMLLALGALGLVAAGILIAYLLTHRGSGDEAATTVVVTTSTVPTAAASVALPRLVGMKEQDALVRLGQLGLRPREVFRPTAKPNRLVVSQKPAATARVPKGSQVTLVIDRGAPAVAVPDLTGRSFADARSALDAAGLDSTRTDVTSTAAAGTVVDQAPKGGTRAAKGSTVTLSIARAGAAATTTGTATTAPTATTATTTTTTTPTTTAPATTAPATTAPPQPATATMPDVQGQTEQAAVSAMSRAGVLASLVFVPGQDPLGTIVQQAKPSGTTVPFRSHVQVNVSKGPNAQADATVPNAVGQTLSQAVSTMNGARLRLIYVKLPVTSQTQAGKIVQQSPLGGGQAPRNAQILVYLGALRKQ